MDVSVLARSARARFSPARARLCCHARASKLRLSACIAAHLLLVALRLSASNYANRRSSPTPVQRSGSEAGPAQINVGRGKTKTTNLKNVGHGAWPSSSRTTQRVWMWSTVIIPHARHGSRAASTVCVFFFLCQPMFRGFYKNQRGERIFSFTVCCLK